MLKIGLLIGLALATLGFLFLCFERVRGKLSLTRYKRELRARHEAVVAAEFLLPPMEGTNGALEITRAQRGKGIHLVG